MRSHSPACWRLYVVGSLLVIGGGACTPRASDPSPGISRLDATIPPNGERHSRQLLAADLAQATGTTAADAVRELRPEFLRGTRIPPGTQLGYPSVYVNGQFTGGVDVLSMIPLEPIIEIRYFAALAARTAFGSYCPCAAGVIAVRTRVGR